MRFPIFTPLTRLALAALAALVLVVAAAPVQADVVTMEDGRRFEGRIVVDDPAEIRIDTMIGSIRTILALQKVEIDTIEEATLPDGFFDPPPVEPRRSPPRPERPENLYLEVPIVGAFGQQVWADGVKRVLAYAKAHRIEHVVFVIDSAGGDLDEASGIYDQLRRYERHLTYHAIIRQCVGDALAIPLWCETIHMEPGGVVGGANAAPDPSDDDPETEALMRAELAHQVARDAEGRGKNGPIIRAMIDPEETLVIWRDEAGSVQTGVSVPASIPSGDVLHEIAAGEVLVIDSALARELGVEPFSGGAAGLGEVLELKDWQGESDYATDQMAKTAIRLSKKRAAEEQKFENNVERNIKRRASIDRLIQGSLQSAQGWDPSHGSYEYYGRRYGWGGSYRGYGRGRGSSSWTLESQQRWQSRTDAALHFLDRAARGIRTMHRLDKDAKKLGLEPTYGPGELEMMLTDVNAKAGMLMNQRGRRGR